MPRLKPALVLGLHAALRHTGLGDELPSKSLVVFLRWGYERGIAVWTSKRMDTVVESIINDIKITNEF
jgi:hypothetical protein